jgi:hypothetical protein
MKRKIFLSGFSYFSTNIQREKQHKNLIRIHRQLGAIGNEKK